MARSVEPDRFREQAETVYPDATASRLARVCQVSQRTAQKWLAGESTIPDDVRTYVTGQFQALGYAGTPFDADLQALIDRHTAEGVDREAIGARLAIAYAALLVREIR